MFHTHSVRRVVTGHDSNGKAVFVRDEWVDPVTVSTLPGSEFHHLWHGAEPPSFPDDGALPADMPWFPGVGGFRFAQFCVPPESARAATDPADASAGVQEMNEKLPGLLSHMEPDAPGMHTSATIDFEVVLDGEVWLELDDGAEVHLQPGDCVVQNGTRHAWRNHGDVTARLAVILIGAHHDKVHPADG